MALILISAACMIWLRNSFLYYKIILLDVCCAVEEQKISQMTATWKTNNFT